MKAIKFAHLISLSVLLLTSVSVQAVQSAPATDTARVFFVQPQEIESKLVQLQAWAQWLPQVYLARMTYLPSSYKYRTEEVALDYIQSARAHLFDALSELESAVILRKNCEAQEKRLPRFFRPQAQQRQQEQQYQFGRIVEDGLRRISLNLANLQAELATVRTYTFQESRCGNLAKVRDEIEQAAADLYIIEKICVK